MSLLDLPKEMYGMIIERCNQKSRVNLGRCNQDFRRIVWYSGLWKDTLTVYLTDNLSYHLLKNRKIFSKIHTLKFGPNCQGLRPMMLAFIAKMTPNVSSIDISEVTDKLFLFGFHVIPTIQTNPFWHDSNLGVTDIKKLLQRLKHLKINLQNYSLGLYMLLDHHKSQCATLNIEVTIKNGRIHHSTPMNQYSIMQFTIP